MREERAVHEGNRRGPSLASFVKEEGRRRISSAIRLAGGGVKPGLMDAKA
jgi:hypothetical protein